jgi:hypothetical protein
MTVSELRECLRDIPAHLLVTITFADYDEKYATCVTVASDGLRICDTADEVSVGEKVLHREDDR